MYFLSQNKHKEISDLIVYLHRIVKNREVSQDEKTGINNAIMTLCELNCINTGDLGLYLDDLRYATRHEVKG